MKNGIKFILMALLLSMPAFAFKQNDIESGMKGKIDKVLVVLKKKESNTQKGQQIISMMDPVFDYNLMSKLTLGSNTWSSITPNQQKEFMKIFVAKLKQSYVDKLDLYHNQNVLYKGVKPYQNGRLQLQTELSGKGETYKINYNFYNSNGNWLIYDVVLDGVSIVQTYRQQFAGILRDKTFDQLLVQLKTKK
ncbi:MAG: ABC transporter substrate-binding protein [Sulfurovaceae bacterium]|nr:ABC transporter substrate-binding protein [Sulfurovaceae bacterium]